LELKFAFFALQNGEHVRFGSGNGGFVRGVVHPHVDFVELWPKFEDHAHDEVCLIKLLTQHGQQQVFPVLGRLVLLRLDAQGAPVLEGRVFPHGQHALPEEVQVGSVRHGSGSAEMLLNHPELLDLQESE